MPAAIPAAAEAPAVVVAAGPVADAVDGQAAVAADRDGRKESWIVDGESWFVDR